MTDLTWRPLRREQLARHWIDQLDCAMPQPGYLLRDLHLHTDQQTRREAS